jgi:L-fuconolactonase
MTRIDAHQHFWKFDPVRDSWITEDMARLQRDFLPHQLLEHLTENQIDGSIAVQVDQSPQETEYLVQLADENPMIQGVVGWADFLNPRVEFQLEQWSSFKKLKGFRHIVQAEAPGFLLNPKFKLGIQKLVPFGFTYDLLIYHHQLSEAVDFVRQFPNQKFVIDHIAKPAIREHDLNGWKEGICKLAEHPHVNCKLSGMVTEADWKNWKAEDFTPYFEIALEAFGPNRLMYGSDWPVCLLAASYSEQLGLVHDFIAPLSPTEKLNIMGENAIRFYNL